MKKSIKVDQKKRGRPATGRGTMVSSRFPQPIVDAVDDWAGKNETTRSDAIRRLVELGLTAKTKAKPTGRVSAALLADLAAEAIDSLGPQVKAPQPVGKPGRRLRAQELATKAIEKIIDPAAGAEERTE